MHYSDNELLVWPFTSNSMQVPSNPRNLNTATYQIKIKFYTSEKTLCLNYKHRIISHCLVSKIIRTTYPALFNIKEDRYIHVITVLNV